MVKINESSKIVIAVVFSAATYGLLRVVMYSFDEALFLEYVWWYLFLGTCSFYLLKYGGQDISIGSVVRFFISSTICIAVVYLHPWTYFSYFAAFAGNPIAIFFVMGGGMAINLICVAGSVLFSACFTNKLIPKPNMTSALWFVLLLLLSSAVAMGLTLIEYPFLASRSDVAVELYIFSEGFLMQLSYGILYYPLFRFLQAEMAHKTRPLGSASEKVGSLDAE